MAKSAQSSRLTLLLNHQIAAVITAMRYNSKWAVVPKYYVSRSGRFCVALQYLKCLPETLSRPCMLACHAPHVAVFVHQLTV